MRIEESVEINRPVEEVYEYVANPENLPEWAGTVIETRKDTPGPLLKGSTSPSRKSGRSPLRRWRVGHALRRWWKVSRGPSSG